MAKLCNIIMYLQPEPGGTDHSVICSCLANKDWLTFKTAILIKWILLHCNNTNLWPASPNSIIDIRSNPIPASANPIKNRYEQRICRFSDKGSSKNMKSHILMLSIIVSFCHNCHYGKIWPKKWPNQYGARRLPAVNIKVLH